MTTPAETARTVVAVEEHTYLVRGRQDDEPVEVRVVVDPLVVERLGAGPGDDEAVVAATITFLLEHQRLDELPPQLDLEDVDAAYDGFAEHLRTHLAAPGERLPGGGLFPRDQL